MCGSSQTYNIPAQKSYGESLGEALKAQAEFLQGTGDFAETGSLESLLPLEESVRKKTAQTDTDILRQTLLGTRQEATSGTYDDEGRLVVGYEGGKEATTVTKNVKPDVEFVEVKKAYKPGIRSTDKKGKPAIYKITFKDPSTGSIIQEGFTPFSGRERDKEMVRSGITPNGKPVSIGLAPSIDMAADSQLALTVDSPGIGMRGQKSLNFFTKQGFTPVDLSNSGKLEATTSTPPKDAVPVYGKDPNGNIIVDKSKAGQTETIPATFAGDGMINLLGDSRNVQEFTTRQATQEDVDAGLASEVGESITEATGDRQAGFDADGNFLGLSAFTEDLARSNLSRQRESDLADVERLSGRFQDVMEDFKPAATSGLDDARLLLEQQRENLTGLRKATQADVDAGLATEVGEMIQTGKTPVTIPKSDTFGGSVTPATMTAAKLGDGPTLDADTSFTPSAGVTGSTFTAAQAANPMALTADTSFTPSAGVTGDGFTATANLQGGSIQADPLRQALMADAQTALGQGLTDREERQIAEAARARATLMGRTFDQSEAIREAEARVLENNARRMQNRAFAQGVLGQEAGLQESDLSRGLQAAAQNQAALNQAAQFGASQDMQAQLANQAAINQARSQGLQAGLSQEALAAQQKQAQEFANMAALNRAREFGASTDMDAQRLNQAALNQARSQGLQAGLAQDAQQAQLDQASDLAQAELTQQANAFGAQSAQQAALADQAQRQQANQFGVGATMDAERLNEQLRQQGLSNYINAVGNLAQMEDKFMLDPFQALLGRGGGGSLQAGQSVFGQAGYGLNSGPQYLNPEAGLGFISQNAANQANMYAANVAADASRSSGIFGGLGALGGGFLRNPNIFGG